MSEERKEPAPEEWATQVVSDIWDRPSIESRGDFHAAMVQSFKFLVADVERRATRAAVEECCRLVAEHQEHIDIAPAQNHVAEPGDPPLCCIVDAIREHFREVLGSENMVSSEEG